MFQFFHSFEIVFVSALLICGAAAPNLKHLKGFIESLDKFVTMLRSSHAAPRSWFAKVVVLNDRSLGRIQSENKMDLQKVPHRHTRVKKADFLRIQSFS